MKLLVSDNVAEILCGSIVLPIVNALRIHKLLQLVQIYDSNQLGHSKPENCTPPFYRGKRSRQNKGNKNTLLQLLLQLQ